MLEASSRCCVGPYHQLSGIFCSIRLDDFWALGDRLPASASRGGRLRDDMPPGFLKYFNVTISFLLQSNACDAFVRTRFTCWHWQEGNTLSFNVTRVIAGFHPSFLWSLAGHPWVLHMFIYMRVFGWAALEGLKVKSFILASFIATFGTNAASSFQRKSFLFFSLILK